MKRRERTQDKKYKFVQRGSLALEFEGAVDSRNLSMSLMDYHTTFCKYTSKKKY